MHYFKRARAKYEQGLFEEALQIYEKGAAIFGDHVVASNITLCKRKLGQTGIATFSSLDDITKILLHNDPQNTFKLSEVELNTCVSNYNKIKNRKSEELACKDVNPIPNDWPKDLKLAPLPESTNDYSWYLKYRYKKSANSSQQGLSVVIPTFNRSNILDITLACLVNQETSHPFEVIVADDGSKEELLKVIRKYESRIDIKFVRQKDYGYQLCAVRNLGMRTAKYDFIAILDCDMAPGTEWIQSYTDALSECEDIAFIGPRKYIDTHEISSDAVLSDKTLIEKLPEVKTNNQVAGKDADEISVDWRLEHFKKTDNLRLCDSPFRYFSGGNVAFSKKWIEKVGAFDEEFTHWGGEDNEFGYRLYRAGCFFKALDGGLAYHQEPPGKENETDRATGRAITIELVKRKVPYFYRKLTPIESATVTTVPLVSIYVPAYNCAQTIKRCVDSALNQTVTDLEVCICDDGSTDNTLDTIRGEYGNNPRVKFVTQENGGIGKASNTAVKLCRGFYIGQLDSDDFLEPDAVETCLKEMLANNRLVCVYTTNRNVDADCNLIANGYNWPTYSRKKLTTAMICHHFRMFTARAWYMTSGFDEQITNAVDYDMYLKLSEVGNFKHINKICYNRVLHGENTSIKKLRLQKENHFKVVNMSLNRQKIFEKKYTATDDKPESRKYSFESNQA